MYPIAVNFHLCYFLLVVLSSFAWRGQCESELGSSLKKAFKAALNHPLGKLVGFEEPRVFGSMDVTARIYTLTSPTTPMIIPMDGVADMENTSLIWLTETKIVIHGYKSSFEKSIFQDMKNSFIEKHGYNVIMVDWKTPANENFAPKAEANAIVVGERLAVFLRKILNQTFADVKMFHMIGHSMGAHIAGVASRHLNKSIARITALDPGYVFSAKLKPTLHLQNDDAGFVDTVYTNLNEMGSPMIVGDLNFFPNGGELQPGCVDIRNNSLLHKNLADAAVNVCSHMSSVQIFTASIGVKPSLLLASPCANYESYTSGLCDVCQSDNTSCVVFGILAQRPEETPEVPVRYYLNTNQKYYLDFDLVTM